MLPGQRMIPTNIVLLVFSKERNPKLGAGSVSLLFSRLTSPEQAGLKCSV